MRIILDTNILISAFLSKRGAPSQVIIFAEKNTVILFSKETMLEFITKILSKKFDSYASTDDRNDYIKLLLRDGEIITITEKSQIAETKKTICF